MAISDNVPNPIADCVSLMRKMPLQRPFQSLSNLAPYDRRDLIITVARLLCSNKTQLGVLPIAIATRLIRTENPVLREYKAEVRPLFCCENARHVHRVCLH